MLKRIVIVSDYGHVNGGSAKVAMMSARALVEAGYPVTFVAGNGRDDAFLSTVPGLEFICLDTPPNHQIPLKKRVKVAIWNREIEGRLREIFERFDPADTIVHTHSYRDVLTAAAPGVIQSRGFREVFTAHDYRLGCAMGDFYDRTKQQVCTLRGNSVGCWLNVCTNGSIPEKGYQNLRYLVQRRKIGHPESLRNVIFVSEFSQRVISPYLSPSARQWVLGNPVDFPKPERRVLTDDSRYLFIGQFHTTKDPLVAARAAKKAGVPITFVGDGPLKDEIAAANPDAILTGWLPPVQVRAEIARSRALIFPSRWYENQPLTLLEAISHGLPVICSDCGVAPELVGSYGAGVTFRTQDEDDLAAKMADWMDPEKTAQISEESYQRFWQNPQTLQSHAEQTLEIYREIMRVAIDNPCTERDRLWNTIHGS